MEYLDILDEKMARLVAFRLRVGASTWWQRLMDDRLRLRFLPLDYDQILFNKYQNQKCIQGQRIVHAYIAEFFRLVEWNYLLETEGQQVTRYMLGLNLAIQDCIGVQMVRSVSEVRNMTLDAEMLIQEHSLVSIGSIICDKIGVNRTDLM